MIGENLDIDSKVFDPQLYVTNFLKNNTIKDLIQKNNEVSNEVKNYDQEIQSLVFENYSKFISSIDTVKKMKNDIFKVDDKMKLLEKSMNKITGLTTKIDSSLKVKREEIQKLETVNQDLQKLNSLCEFPNIIQKDLNDYKDKKYNNEEIDYNIAFKESIKAYEMCFSMLSQFQNEPLVKPIYSDSIDKVHEIRSILWNSQNFYQFKGNLKSYLENEQSSQEKIKLQSDSQQIKYISKKLIIITEDQESVLRNYLKIVKDKINEKTKAILNFSPQNLQNIQEIQSIQQQIFNIFKQKDYIISLNDVEQLKTKIEQDYLDDQQNNQGSLLWVVKLLEEIIFDDLREEIQFLLSDIEPIISQNKHCIDLIDNSIKDIVMGILHNLSQKLNEVSSVISNIDIRECFRILNDNISKIIIQNELVKRTLKSEVQQRFNENIEQICKGQILKGFNNLRNYMLDCISDLKQECYKFSKQEDFEQIQDDIIQVESDLKKKVFDLLTDLKNKFNAYYYFVLIDLNNIIFYQEYLPNPHHFLSILFAQTLDFQKSFVKILLLNPHQISQETLETVNSAVLNKNNSTNFLQQQQNQILELEFMRHFEEYKSQEQSSVYYLVTNQFLQLYQQSLASEVFDNLLEVSQQNLPKISIIDPSINQYFQQFKQTLQNQEIPKLFSYIRQSQMKNSIAYSQFHAQQLLKNTFTPYLKKQIPFKTTDTIDITKSIEQFAYTLKSILVEVSVLFPDMKRGMSKKGSFLKIDQEFDIDMQKMMVKKLHNFHLDQENSTRNFVLNSIISTFFKSLNEMVRISLKGVTKNSYSQLFIDVYFIIQLAYETVSVDDENLLIAFFHEIIDNVAFLALEQIPSKQEIQHLAETISQQKRQKLKF